MESRDRGDGTRRSADASGEATTERSDVETTEREIGAPTALSLARRVFSIRTLVSFGLAAAVLLLFVTQVKIDVAATLQAVTRANPLYYLLALLCHYLVFPIRAARWRQMLLNSGWRDEELPTIWSLGEIILISAFVNCIVPAKLGDVYRAYLLGRRARLSGSKAGGTIVAERVLDMTVLLLLGGTAVLIILWDQPYETVRVLIGPFELLAGIVLVAAIGLFVMRRWSHSFRELIPRGLNRVYTGFAEGATRSLGRYHLLLPYSILAWLVEAARLYFVIRALGLTLNPNPEAELAMVLAVALIGSLLTAVPLTPAGLGFVESGLVFALLLFGAADQRTAPSIAFLDRTISYFSVIAVGLVFYLARSRHDLAQV